MKILNLFDLELQLSNTKPAIKDKFKRLLRHFKKFKAHSMLVSEYKKRNDCKVFHFSFKLIVSDSAIDEAFKSMHESIMAKMKNSAGKYSVVI